ncbi:MAG: hypothetical protein RIC16_15140 [Rhodospirillales bacterium]
MTERDELAFDRVLREFDPAMKVACADYDPVKRNSTLVPSLPHGTAEEAHFQVLTPYERERATLFDDLGLGEREQEFGYTLRRSKWKWLDPSIKWAFDPPLLAWGEVTVAYSADGGEEVAKTAAKLLRLVNKVTWKRTGFGLDACRWSQAGQPARRNGLGNGQLIDPSEPIKLNKYYDDSLWDDCLPDEPTGCRVAYEYPGETHATEPRGPRPAGSP